MTWSKNKGVGRGFEHGCRYVKEGGIPVKRRQDYQIGGILGKEKDRGLGVSSRISSSYISLERGEKMRGPLALGLEIQD